MSHDRYEIRGKIGQGGVGAVYRAFDRNLNREVAIKRVLAEEGFDASNPDDEATKSLLKEATALCSIQHPHIVTVYDAGVDEDGPYVVMELLGGRTLDEMVERGTMTWPDFREVAIQAEEALIAAQELDLVHRDIKPSNVMVTWLPSGKFQVKLLDFGLAKFSPKPSLQTIDHSDAVFGSIHFMAPEQFERIHLDKRTDMYSLGAVFYFALAGRYPFDGDTAPQVMAAHLNNTYTPLKEIRPDVPDWACQWIQWHMSREMDERPVDAREALERFFAFDQPVNSATAPVEIQAVPAASLRTSPLSPTTGPVPVHSQPAAKRPQLITGNVLQSAAPAQGAVATTTGPQPILPPPGSKPSIHTGSQQVRATTGPVPLHTTPPPPPPPPAHAPAATPVDAPAPAPAPQPGFAPKPKSNMSTAAKATIATLLGAAIVVTGIVLFSKLSDNKAAKELQTIADLAAKPTTTEVPLNKDKLTAIFDHVSAMSFDEDKPALYQALYLARATDGTDIDREIARFATKSKMHEDIRVQLFRVLNQRKADSVAPDLINFASGTKETKAAVAALGAASAHLTRNEINPLLSLISFGKDDSVRRAAESALRTYAESQGKSSLDGLAEDLAKAYQAAVEPEAKETYLRLLGSTGSDKAEAPIRSALESEERPLKIAAFSALQNWPNDSLFELHLESYVAETDSFTKSHGFDTLLGFLRNSDGENQEKQWKELALAARSDDEKMELIRALGGGFDDDWAISIVEVFRNDKNDDVSYLAERALEKMNR